MTARLVDGTVRKLGIEEELLLADVATGELRPVSREVIAACAPSPGSEDGVQIKHEFFLSQVEVASSPRAEVGAIRDELTGARERIAVAGAEWGVVPLAVPGPVLARAAERQDDFSPGERYAEIDRHYGDVARRSLMCALHVHVEVADDEEGVAVIDRLRPWIPVLLAISANSPYWEGRDSGYASWRSRVWNLWPTGGPGELFGDAATYHAVADDMVRRGAALDLAMVNLDVRLSHRYPTVEFRMADVCTDIDDALLVAALARALVTHAASRWRAGDPPEPWRVDELRAAAWRAARFGLSDTLVSPESRVLTDAGEVLEQLVAMLTEPLERAGDLGLVARGLAVLQARGNGASRQRAAFAETGDLSGVVADLGARTLTSSA
ncbi:MAG: glutamate--cysteine ligase [Nocardioides sp.]